VPRDAIVALFNDAQVGRGHEGTFMDACEMASLNGRGGFVRPFQGRSRAASPDEAQPEQDSVADGAWAALADQGALDVMRAMEKCSRLQAARSHLVVYFLVVYVSRVPCRSVVVPAPLRTSEDAPAGGWPIQTAFAVYRVTQQVQKELFEAPPRGRRPAGVGVLRLARRRECACEK
jgi:hypothetical protein